MTTHTNPPLWTGAFVRICLVNLFIFVNVHALLPTFPFYVASQGGGAVAIGIATALFSLASIAARPFVGHVADARGRRPLLVAGTLGLVLLSAGYAVAGALTLALVMRAAHGDCHAAASNASNTWVTDLLHAADRRRRDYCLHYTGCDWGDRRYYHALIDSGRTDALGVLRALAQQQG